MATPPRAAPTFKRASGIFGLGNLATDRYNVMLTASYQKEGALYGRDRSFANSGINSFNDTSSGNTFPANVAALDGSFGSVNPSAAGGCLAPYSTLDPNFPNTVCRFDPAPLVTLIPAAERISFFASGKYAITPDVQAYAEASYNRNTTRVIIQPVPLSDQFNIPTNNVLCGQAPYNTVAPGSCVSAIVLAPTSPFYPTGLRAGHHRRRDARPAGSLSRRGERQSRLHRHRRRRRASSPASRALAMGWDFDAAALYSESRVKEVDNDGYPSLTQIMPLLNSGTVNFFGPNTPDVDAALRAANFTGNAYTIKSSLTSLAGRGSRDVYTLPGGPLGLAVGVEGRKEKYDFDASPAIATGDISGYGGNLATVNKTRNVGAVFTELSMPFATGWEADAAVRYDHYEGVGGSTTPKVSLRWQPMPQVLLRTSYGRGFRAPSLQDLYAPQTQGVTPQGADRPAALPDHRRRRQGLRNAVRRHQWRPGHAEARDLEELHPRHRARAGQQRVARHRLLQCPASATPSSTASARPSSLPTR